MPVRPADVRILLDEDVPPGLTEALRQRGYNSESLHEHTVRDRIIARRGTPGDTGTIPDVEVAAEAGQQPTVLVTLNVRDYSDPHQHAELVEQHGLTVAQVRIPKSESGRGRPHAIFDIVHRWAHRLVPLADRTPKILNPSGKSGGSCL